MKTFKRRDPVSTPARRRRIIADIAKATLRGYYVQACLNVFYDRLWNAKALVIQCSFRQHRARKLLLYRRFKRKYDNACRIQAIWRRKLAYRRIKRLRHDRYMRQCRRLVKVVESLYSIYKAKMYRYSLVLLKQIRLQKLREQCAVRIQTQYRRHVQVQAYIHAVYWYRLKPWHINYRAVLIQKSLRGWLERIRYRTFVIRRNMMQLRWEWWKFEYGRSMQGRKKKSAILLQRMTRGHLVRLRKLLLKPEPLVVCRIKQRCVVNVAVEEELKANVFGDEIVYIPLPAGQLDSKEVLSWLEEVGVLQRGEGWVGIGKVLCGALKLVQRCEEHVNMDSGNDDRPLSHQPMLDPALPPLSSYPVLCVDPLPRSESWEITMRSLPEWIAEAPPSPVSFLPQLQSYVSTLNASEHNVQSNNDVEYIYELGPEVEGIVSNHVTVTEAQQGGYLVQIHHPVRLTLPSVPLESPLHETPVHLHRTTLTLRLQPSSASYSSANHESPQLLSGIEFRGRKRFILSLYRLPIVQERDDDDELSPEDDINSVASSIIEEIQTSITPPPTPPRAPSPPPINYSIFAKRIQFSYRQHYRKQVSARWITSIIRRFVVRKRFRQVALEVLEIMRKSILTLQCAFRCCLAHRKKKHLHYLEYVYGTLYAPVVFEDFNEIDNRRLFGLVATNTADTVEVADISSAPRLENLTMLSVVQSRGMGVYEGVNPACCLLGGEAGLLPLPTFLPPHVFSPHRGEVLVEVDADSVAAARVLKGQGVGSMLHPESKLSAAHNTAAGSTPSEISTVLDLPSHFPTNYVVLPLNSQEQKELGEADLSGALPPLPPSCRPPIYSKAARKDYELAYYAAKQQS